MPNALSRSYAELRDTLEKLQDNLEERGRSVADTGHDVARRARRANPWRRPEPNWYDRPAQWYHHGSDYVRERPGVAGLVAAGAALVLVGGAIYAARRTSLYIEEPDYDVVDRKSEFEVREYGKQVVAEAHATGRREQALKAGFHKLADYIFARQRPGKKIAMTAPVVQAPVVGENGRRRGWAVRFIMPAKWSLADLPKPAQDDVVLKEMSPRRVAAVRFSGQMNDRLALENLEALRLFIEDHGLKAIGEPIYAYYNPPMTPGFMRRNEIMVEVSEA
ncbi:heme-binding protein [Afifella sp. H1R]|uniref:SOUL family heme-binding protein n=1 Tax=Afifella sp. H1R TaxID=2908841 RepID=UPI001F25A67D|nr:heme-binding protein [Afifella sp. H1R]MCF1504510.1 heme-binding protein [Afifella sp. H1R]